MNKNRLGIRLDTATTKKLKEFAILNRISQSEIIRVLIEKSKIKVDNVRTAVSVIQNGRYDKVNRNLSLLYLNDEMIYKINEMKLENNASHSEIVRCLINNADLSNLKFKSRGEVIQKAKENTSKNEMSCSLFNDKYWKEVLLKSSVSEQDVKLRKKVYANLFNNYAELKEKYKMLTGYTETPFLFDLRFHATVVAYIRSFAGFLSIERDMEMPTALLWYTDNLGVTYKRTVLSSIRQEELDNINARFEISKEFVVGQNEYKVSTNKKLYPGSIRIKFIHAVDPTKFTIIIDDGNGNLLAHPEVLSPNSDGGVNINYQTGLIIFTVGNAFAIKPGDTYSIMCYDDTDSSPAGNNKLINKYILVTAKPEILIAEHDLIATATMQKANTTNYQDVYHRKLVELYIESINRNLVEVIKTGWNDNTAYKIDATSFNKYTDSDYRAHAFQTKLGQINTELKNRSGNKDVEATAYIVGQNMGNWFIQLCKNHNFIDKTGSDYINGLIGYYKGIPVLCHNDIETNDGYAIHKTADGQLAPVIRGIYLPLTNTPIIGNYYNPTQFVRGIYYQEAIALIAPELIQKFTIDDSI